MDRIAIVAFQS